MAHDLVSRNDGNTRLGQLTVDDVQIGAAHAASADLHANLPGSRLPVREFHPFERRLQTPLYACIGFSLFTTANFLIRRRRRPADPTE